MVVKQYLYSPDFSKAIILISILPWLLQSLATLLRPEDYMNYVISTIRNESLVLRVEIMHCDYCK